MSSDTKVSVQLCAAFPPQSAAATLQELADMAKDVPGLDRDVYGVGDTLNAFENRLAKLLGKDAGLFMISGVMAQQIALRLHAHNRNRIFACHPTCHLVLHEEKAYEHLNGFSCCMIGEKTAPLTSQDVERAIKAHWKTPSSLIIELPFRELGGQCLAWEELVKIREFTKKYKIALHLDGARLWEAQAYYDKTYAEICSMFDSVYVSFYKGIGAMTGAMLLGSDEFIDEARVWLKRFGGGVYTYLPYVVSAQVNFNRQFNHFQTYRARMRALVTQVVIVTAGEKDLVRFVPPIPHVNMCHVYMKRPKDNLEAARDHVLKTTGIQVFDRLRGITDEECYFEWKVGPHNAAIDTALVKQGWTAFLAYLKDNVPPPPKAAHEGKTEEEPEVWYDVTDKTEEGAGEDSVLEEKRNAPADATDEEFTISIRKSA